MEEIQEKESIPQRLTGIVWGIAGCGKTALLSTLPGKKLLINFDPDGHLSVPTNADYALMDMTGTPDDVAIRGMERKLPSQLEQLEGFDSIIVDSLTMFANRSLRLAVDRKVGASKKGGKDWVPTIEEPGLTAYGARRQYILQTVTNILRATSKKNMHCFFTTHQGDADYDLKGNLLGYSMMLGGKAVNDTALQLSEVWFMSATDQGQRRIAVRKCRNREPMKTRMFDTAGSPEFTIDFDPELGEMQPHSLSTFHKMWLWNSRRKLPLPDTKQYMSMYEKWKDENGKDTS